MNKIREKITDEIFNKLKEAMPDLIEKYFPKGACEERGNATVAMAELICLLKEKSLEENERKYCPIHDNTTGVVYENEEGCNCKSEKI